MSSLRQIFTSSWLVHYIILSCTGCPELSIFWDFGSHTVIDVNTHITHIDIKMYVGISISVAGTQTSVPAATSVAKHGRWYCSTGTAPCRYLRVSPPHSLCPWRPLPQRGQHGNSSTWKDGTAGGPMKASCPAGGLTPSWRRGCEIHKPPIFQGKT